MAASTEYFRFKDSLENFVLRVHLRKLTMRDDRDRKEGEEVLEVKWQQKYFSAREQQLYSVAPGPVAGERMKCHHSSLHQQLQSNNGARPNKRLYSYTEGDPECIAVGVTSSLTTASPDTSTTPSLLATTVRRRANRSSCHPIVERPSEEMRARSRVTTPPQRTMLIAADLGGDLERGGAEDEHILCSVQVDHEGVLSLAPGLASSQEWSKLESRQQEMFEYRLEHASPAIANSSREKERGIAEELTRQRTRDVASTVGPSFDCQSDSKLRVAVFGEIVSARDFEQDDLFISSSLRLPPGWQAGGGLDGDSPSTGLTTVSQICHSKSHHLANEAYFAFPFCYHLLFDGSHHSSDGTMDGGDDDDDDDDATEPCRLSMPTVHFEVVSIDSWDCHRSEGHAHWPLPPAPGYYNPVVHTWRPMGKTLLEEMRRYFLGGGPQLEDIAYAGIPGSVKGPHVAKYGMQTKTSGSIQLRVNIVHQSRALQEAHTARLAWAQPRSALLLSTEAILENYRRTKFKMAASLQNQSEGVV